MSNLKQMNTWLEPAFIDEVERLAEIHFESKADTIRAAIRILAEVMSSDDVERLADTHGWSKAEAVQVAIRTLSDVMAKHEEALRHPDDVTRPADDEIRDLYMAVAREIPYDLVEVVRSLDPRYVGDQPVIRAEGWLIWRDQATDDLIAREEAGEQRFGRLINGRIEVMVSPAAASLN